MKSRKKNLLLYVLSLLALIIACFGAAACGSEEEIVPGPESGEYYFADGSTEYLISLHDGNRFDFAVKGKSGMGTYALNDTTLTMTFEGGEELVAVYAGNTITFVYENVTYRYLKKINFTVSFSVDGTIASTQTVLNGKTVAKPSDPQKTGSVFVNWYTDSALKNVFHFTEPITADTTLYARFVSAIANPVEFTVSFDLGYEGAQTYDPVQTLQGKLYGLPEPQRADAEFIGWWVSQDNSAQKLTYKYEEQTIEENTTLFAVWGGNGAAVSVGEDGISWEAPGANNSYTVKITAPDGTTESNTVSVDRYDYDFASKAEGEYIVEVTVNGVTTAAYYKNKALARVSVFQVEDSTLVFNTVANAEKYLIAVKCGNPDHDHTATDECATPGSYDFSACEMTENGISFVVTAQAAGFLSSVSAEYVYTRTLPAVQGLTVDKVRELAKWEAVEGATGYLVVVDADGEETYRQTIEGCELDLKTYGAQNLSIYVAPVAHGWLSPEATRYDYAKYTMAAPSNVRVEGYQAVWDAVPGAAGYTVKINDRTYRAESNYFDLSRVELNEGFELSVSTVAQTESGSSPFTDPIKVSKGNMNDNLRYDRGVVYWDAVFGVTKYVVRVNDSAEQIVEGSSYAVTLTRKGGNEIKVCAILDEASGSRTDWVTIDVTAYEVTFDSQKGSAVSPQFKATNDPLVLPSPTRSGYGLNGWFTAPGGTSGEGRRYGEVFTAETDITLYAAWDANGYEITFDVGAFGEEDVDPVTVYYEQNYTLPVPTATSVTKVFLGWYAEPNGQGTAYTDVGGKSYRAWDYLDGRKLYAKWGDLFTFERDGDGFAVSKGKDISAVTEVTIPVTYTDPATGEELRVVTVESFASCTNLRVIHIPDTVKLISIAGAGVAFTGCTNLREIDIYHVISNRDVLYESENGALIYHDESTGLTELQYVPQAITGVFDVPDGVQVILDQLFLQARNITEINIPESVISIGQNAFSPRTSVNATTTNKLEKVTFLGTGGNPLKIAAKAFQYCSTLTEVTLPSRLEEIAINVFDGCTSLVTVNISGTGGIYQSVEGLLCKTEDGVTTVVYGPSGISGSYRIPSGISAIGESAFAKNTNLTSITIPGYITDIGKEAFSKCTNIEEIIFEGTESDPALSIGQSAFYSCAVVSVTLPENLNKLGKNAFGGNSKLVEVHVESGPKGISFESGAFASTSGTTYVTTLYLGQKTVTFDIGVVFGTKLAQVIVADGNPYFSSDKDGVLYDANQTSIQYYPDGKEGAFVVPETVEKIAGGTFKSKTGLTAITIGANVREIGAEAFSECSSLERIVLRDAVQTVSADADEVATLDIGERAFYHCTSLLWVELPARTRTIGAEAFRLCSKLGTSRYESSVFRIPEGVMSIGKAAFTSTAIKKISLPSTLEFMGDATAQDNVFDVFQYCNSLESITVEESSEYYTTIDGVLYRKTDGVAKDLLFTPRKASGDNGVVHIPSTVERIWEKAFEGNANIREVIFEELAGECQIYQNAFYQCVAINKIVLPRGLTAIGGNVFYGCTALEEVFIPNTVKTISTDAFYQCYALTTVDFEEGNLDNPLVLEDGKIVGGGYESVGVRHGVFSYCTSLQEIVFPERMTKIGSYVFAYCDALESITIPASVTEIGASAFYQLGIKEVNFAPDSKLETIGKEAFSGCAKLTSIKFPAGLKTIENSAFTRCTSLASIDLPEGIETIGRAAFTYAAFEELTIPASLTLLGEYNSTNPAPGSAYGEVFEYNNALRTVTFADNSKLEALFNFTFSYCPNLTTVDFGTGGNLQTFEGAFKNLISLERLVIPASVTLIANNAFDGDISLESVTFEEGTKLASIGNSAFTKTGLTEFAFPETENPLTLGEKLFLGCGSLTKVTLSSSVASIDNVFTGCTSIKVIVVDPGNVNFKADKDLPILYNADGTAIRLVYGSVGDEVLVLDEGIETIGAGAFAARTDLIAVVIPASVRTIGDKAFNSCVNLQSVTFAEGSRLEKIEDEAFRFCYALKDINLEDCEHLSQIGTKTKSKYGVFAECKSLTSVDLRGAALSEIQVYTFDGCSSLTEVLLPSTVEIIRQCAFQNCTSLEQIDLSGVSSLKYLGGTYNTAFSNMKQTTASSVFAGCANLSKVLLPAGLVTIGASTFSGCERLTGIDLGESLQYLGNSAFVGTSIREISIPATVEALGTYVFQNCTDLASVDFCGNTKLKALGNYMFQGCTSLEEIVLPTSLNFLGKNTFQNSGLKRIDLSALKDLKTIGASAGSFNNGTSSSNTTYTFADCTALTTVVLPASCTKIGSYTFDGCTSLSQINLEDVVAVGAYAFHNCGFTTLTVPKITSSSNLGTYSFAENKNLTAIDFTPGITYLGVNMFNGCGALEEVTLPKSISSFGTYVFANCTALTSVTFEKGMAATKFGNYMFENCTNLESVDLGGNAFTQFNSYMFRNCTSLEEITIPDSLQYIDTEAFAGSGIRTLDLSKTKMTRLGGTSGNVGSTTNSGSFRDCTNLTEVILPSTIDQISGYVFFGCTNLKSIDLKTVTVIGTYAFAESGLEKVTIPKTVNTIYAAAFGGISSLDYIEVEPGNGSYQSPEGILLTSEGKMVAYPAGMGVEGGVLTIEASGIAGGALHGVQMTELVLEEGVTQIDEYAFAYCPAQKVSLPASLVWIGQFAFYHASFEEVDIPENVISVGTSAFESSDVGKVVFHAPTDIKYYNLTNPNSLFNSTYLFRYSTVREVVFAEGMTSINSGWFQETTALDSVKLPATLTTISSQAFYGSGIKNVEIPASVVSISYSAFAETPDLQKVTFLGTAEDAPLVIQTGATAASVAAMGAFENSAVKEVVLSPRVVTIPERTFYGAKELNKVTMPVGVQEISSKAFYGTTSLQKIDFPEGLIKIGDSAFCESGLISVKIPDSVETNTLISTNLGAHAFQDCVSLESVILSQNLQLLGSDLFSGCVSLREIEIPESVSELGAGIFTGCTSLQNLYIPATVLECGNGAFSGFTANQTIRFGESEAAIYSWWATNTGQVWKNGCEANLVFGVAKA